MLIITLSRTLLRASSNDFVSPSPKDMLYL